MAAICAERRALLALCRAATVNCERIPLGVIPREVADGILFVLKHVTNVKEEVEPDPLRRVAMTVYQALFYILHVVECSLCGAALETVDFAREVAETESISTEELDAAEPLAVEAALCRTFPFLRMIDADVDTLSAVIVDVGQTIVHSINNEAALDDGEECSADFLQLVFQHAYQITPTASASDSQGMGNAATSAANGQTVRRVTEADRAAAVLQEEMRGMNWPDSGAVAGDYEEDDDIVPKKAPSPPSAARVVDLPPTPARSSPAPVARAESAKAEGDSERAVQRCIKVFRENLAELDKVKQLAAEKEESLQEARTKLANAERVVQAMRDTPPKVKLTAAIRRGIKEAEEELNGATAAAEECEDDVERKQNELERAQGDVAALTETEVAATASSDHQSLAVIAVAKTAATEELVAAENAMNTATDASMEARVKVERAQGALKDMRGKAGGSSASAGAMAANMAEAVEAVRAARDDEIRLQVALTMLEGRVSTAIRCATRQQTKLESLVREHKVESSEAKELVATRIGGNISSRNVSVTFAARPLSVIKKEVVTPSTPKPEPATSRDWLTAASESAAGKARASAAGKARNVASSSTSAKSAGASPVASASKSVQATPQPRSTKPKPSVSASAKGSAHKTAPAARSPDVSPAASPGLAKQLLDEVLAESAGDTSLRRYFKMCEEEFSDEQPFPVGFPFLCDNTNLAESKTREERLSSGAKRDRMWKVNYRVLPRAHFDVMIPLLTRFIDTVVVDKKHLYQAEVHGKKGRKGGEGKAAPTRYLRADRIRIVQHFFRFLVTMAETECPFFFPNKDLVVQFLNANESREVREAYPKMKYPFIMHALTIFDLIVLYEPFENTRFDPLRHYASHVGRPDSLLRSIPRQNWQQLDSVSQRLLTAVMAKSEHVDPYQRRLDTLLRVVQQTPNTRNMEMEISGRLQEAFMEQNDREGTEGTGSDSEGSEDERRSPNAAAPAIEVAEDDEKRPTHLEYLIEQVAALAAASSRVGGETTRTRLPVLKESKRGKAAAQSHPSVAATSNEEARTTTVPPGDLSRDTPWIAFSKDDVVEPVAKTVTRVLDNVTFCSADVDPCDVGSRGSGTHPKNGFSPILGSGSTVREIVVTVRKRLNFMLHRPVAVTPIQCNYVPSTWGECLAERDRDSSRMVFGLSTDTTAVTVILEREGHRCKTRFVLLAIYVRGTLSPLETAELLELSGTRLLPLMRESPFRWMLNKERKDLCGCQGDASEGAFGRHKSIGCIALTIDGERTCMCVKMQEERLPFNEGVSDEDKLAITTGINQLADTLAKHLRVVAPATYRNMTLFSETAQACRLGDQPHNAPFALAGILMDGSAHLHYNTQEGVNGVTMMAFAVDRSVESPLEDKSRASSDQMLVLPDLQLNALGMERGGPVGLRLPLYDGAILVAAFSHLKFGITAPEQRVAGSPGTVVVSLSQGAGLVRANHGAKSKKRSFGEDLQLASKRPRK